MKGYWQDEDSTKAVINKEGWFKTGDVGSLDEEGYFKIVGR